MDLTLNRPNRLEGYQPWYPKFAQQTDATGKPKPQTYGVRQISPGIWRAGVGHNGVKVNVGCFKTLEEAEAAVIAKRIELFTHNDADRRTKN